MFDDSDDIGGAFSFADMEAREATRFADSLRSLDSRMYTEILSSGAIAKKKTGDDDERTMNYYSEGYEANYEAVEDAELLQWQKSSFKFLNITGQALPLPFNNTTDIGRYLDSEVASVDPTKNNYIEATDTAQHFTDHKVDNLAIVGKRIKICCTTYGSPSGFACNGEAEEDEEIIVSHGILEEVIVANAGHDDRTDADEEDGTAPRPETSVRAEVLASMVDTIWPDVVAAMKPLIHDVLVAAKENNIPYAVDQAPAKAKAGEGMDYEGGFGFASDDDGGW
jgi:hypothetical protein